MVAATDSASLPTTPRSTPVPSKGIDWMKARTLFIESHPRPTYGELAAEIGCAEGSLSRLSSEQGWPALRAQYMERKLVESDASGQLAQALSVDRTMTDGVSSVALVTLSALVRTVESMDEEKAASTKAQTLNTVSFALKNVADSLKAVGLVGLAKNLDPDGKSGGKWDPKILNQINLTVQQAKDGLELKAKPVQEAESAGVHPPAG